MPRMDERLRPLSSDSQQRSQVRQTRVSARCLDGRMRVDITDGTGETRQSEVGCDSAFFPETLPDLIVGRSNDSRQRLVRTSVSDGDVPRSPPSEAPLHQLRCNQGLDSSNPARMEFSVGTVTAAETDPICTGWTPA